MPLILFKFNRILYWGNAGLRLDFTTMDNAEEYTAMASVDTNTPRYLHIVGDQLSPREIKNLASAVSGNNFELFRPEGLGFLSILFKVARTLEP